MYVKMKIEKEDAEPFDDAETESGLPINIIYYTCGQVYKLHWIIH